MVAGKGAKGGSSLIVYRAFLNNNDMVYEYYEVRILCSISSRSLREYEMGDYETRGISYLTTKSVWRKRIAECGWVTLLRINRLNQS